MKRIIAAALLASMTVPALAVEIGAPYEQAQVDRQLPDVKDPIVRLRAAQVAGPASGIRFTEATGPWANDWNFIAPAN